MKKLIVLIAGLALASAAVAQVDTTRPMLTGRGNVSVRPEKTIVTNQTAPAPAAGNPVELAKFEVTGSLMKHPAAKAVARK
jgi:hypothetical protein